MNDMLDELFRHYHIMTKQRLARLEFVITAALVDAYMRGYVDGLRDGQKEFTEK